MTTDATSRTPADAGPGSSSRAPLATAVASALADRALLTHPFYRRWEAGGLTRGELAEYAVQYRAFEAALPLVLEQLEEALVGEGRRGAAELVALHLADERGRPEPHLTLFDRFADAVGADPTQPAGPAATDLVDTYRTLTAQGPAATLAGLAAYESQAAAIAASKADGLRRHYGLDAAATEFWDVHAAVDADHGAWTLEALAQCGSDPLDAHRAARAAAEAWWALLDEREAEAPA